MYLELKTGPGKLTPTGAIIPHGPAKVAVNVAFKLYEARRMAASVLAYIQAWDVLRMLAHKQVVGQPVPYTSAPLSPSLLVATASEHNGVQSMSPRPENGMTKANGASRQPSDMRNGRPVTRKDVGRTNGAAAKPAHGKPPVSEPVPTEPVLTEPVLTEPVLTGPVLTGPVLTGPLPPPETAVSAGAALRYGNGVRIDSANVIERQTFQRYVAENQAAPQSKAALLAYYRQQGTAANAAQP